MSFASLGLSPALLHATRELGFSTPTPVQAEAIPAILRGAKRPTDCKLFGKACTPENPMGACMVSSEGSCAAYWTYGRFRGESAA